MYRPSMFLFIFTIFLFSEALTSVASSKNEIAKELLPLIRVYKNGTVERFVNPPFVPPSKEDPETGVSSKDVTISDHPKISVRLYYPKLKDSDKKLPIFVYFHGGFFLGSAFDFYYHRYVNHIVSEAKVIAISVDYRLAPEHPLPAAYEDCWAALQWVASKKESWLVNRGDFDKLFIGGDSSGANIAHNIAMKAGKEDLPHKVKILGAIISHPYFWSSKDPKNLGYFLWEFVYPNAPGGIDNPMVNPAGPKAPSLARLGCSKMLVCVAEEDELRDKGVWYYEKVKKSGWKGEVELFEVKGEGHAFHILDTDKEASEDMFRHFASFINKYNHIH